MIIFIGKYKNINMYKQLYIELMITEKSQNALETFAI